MHLTGHFNINRAAINLFREQNYGRIIMVSSTSGLLGNLGQCNYGAAKLGIVALARIVASLSAEQQSHQWLASAPHAASRVRARGFVPGAAPTAQRSAGAKRLPLDDRFLLAVARRGGPAGRRRVSKIRL